MELPHPQHVTYRVEIINILSAFYFLHNAQYELNELATKLSQQENGRRTRILIFGYWNKNV